jgi:glycosyltransferase involved in cell wall biosynthesis
MSSWVAVPRNKSKSLKMQNLQVLHVVSVPGVGGAQAYVEMVAGRLRNLGCDVAVVCNDDPRLIARYARSAEVYPMVIPYGFSPWSDLKFFISLMRLLRREQFDVVQTSAAKASLYGRFAARLAGIPVVIFTAHGFPFHDFMSPLLRSFLITLERLMSRWCTDMVISVSENDRHMAITNGIVPPERVVTIRNGIDLNRQFPDRETARHGLGLSPGRPVVGMIGRLSAQKAPDDFLRVASLVSRQFPDATFLVVGDGPLRRRVERQAIRLGIARSTKFLGFRDDVPLILAALDVFVLTSLWEGLPITILEAMAAGKPVVATTVSGVPEVVEHGVTGFLAPPKKVEQLATHVVTLLRDSVLAQKMGQAGRHRIEKCFTLDQMTARLTDLYHELYRMKCPEGFSAIEKSAKESSAVRGSTP